MTTTEILLAIILGLFTAKEIWGTIRNHKNKNTEVELASIDSNNKALIELRESNKLLTSNLKIVQAKYNEIKVAFSIIYPSLEKLMDNDPAQKKTLKRLCEIIEEE